MATNSGYEGNYIQALREDNAMLIKLVGRLRKELRTDQMLYSVIAGSLSHGHALADDSQPQGSPSSSSIACSDPISNPEFPSKKPVLGNGRELPLPLPHSKPESMPQPDSLSLLPKANSAYLETESTLIPTLTHKSVDNEAVSDCHLLLNAQAKKSKKKRNKERKFKYIAKEFSPSDCQPATLPSTISGRFETADFVHADKPSIEDDKPAKDNILTAPTFFVEELRKGVHQIESYEPFDLPSMVKNVLQGGNLLDLQLVDRVNQDEVDADKGNFHVIQDQITEGVVAGEKDIVVLNHSKDCHSCCEEVALQDVLADEAGAVVDNEVEGGDAEKILDIDFGEADRNAIGDEEGETFTQYFVDGIELLHNEAKPDKACDFIDGDAEAQRTIELETVGKLEQGIVSEDVKGSCSRHCIGQGSDDEEDESVKNVAKKMEIEIEKGKTLSRTCLWMLSGAVAIGVGSLFYACTKLSLKAIYKK